MEGDVIVTQDLFIYDIVGEDPTGKLIGRHRSTGVGRPRFWDGPATTARTGRSPPPSTRRNSARRGAA